MNNAVFGKIMKNLIRYKGIKLATSEARRNYLVSEPNCHSRKKIFFWIFVSNKMKKNPQIFVNKPIYLNLSTLEMSKILMYKFWCNYVKPKYDEKAIPLYF